MSEPKTKRNKINPYQFISTIDNPTKKDDAKKIIDMMKQASGCEPVMWGSSIVGFDTYELIYANGKIGTWPKIGFSPRKQALTLYIGEFEGKENLLKQLGKHKTGKSCLYIKKLADVNTNVLQDIIQTSLDNFEGGC